MSRKFSATFDDCVSPEIEQYAYAKTGKSVSFWIAEIIVKEMSRNGLTQQQYNRVVKKYGDATIVQPGGSGATLKGEKD